MRGAARLRRFSGSRLAAALLMAAAAIVAIMRALEVHPLSEGASARPYFTAALLCGMIAGWRNMGRALGDGLGRAALGGVSAGISGLMYFLVLAGIRETVRVYRFTQFDTPGALLEHLIEQMIRVFWVAMDPPVLLALLAGSALAGLFSEVVQRLWD